MAISHKYGKVTLEKSTIGENEPIVVFRAKDKLLPYVLENYYFQCKEIGCEQEHLDAIILRKGEILDWQLKNGSKIPDTKNYGK